MSNNLAELMAQKAALEKQIAEMQTSARKEAIAKVKAIMTEYNLTIADLTAQARGQRIGPGTTGTVSRVAPKYRDPVGGGTWTGRGLKPKWLQAALAEGKTLADFLIAAEA